MRRRFVRPLFALILATGLAAGAALAQDGEGRTWFTALLESLLSTPDRQVTLAGLEGVFSANPRIARVTVADREGVWLELQNLDLTWNRSALFDRTIEIESLRASRVAMLRKPAASTEAHAGGGVSPPPLAIDLKAIALPQILLSAPVAGEEAELTAVGSARVAADALAAELTVDRQDRAGSLSLNLRLEPQANVLTADVKLEEPAGGLVADLLGLRDRPSIAATLTGTGPLDAWRGTFEFAAGGNRILTGGMAVSRTDDAYRVAAEFAAALQSVVPRDYAMLVAGESRLAFDLSRSDDGAIFGPLGDASLRGRRFVGARRAGARHGPAER